MPLICGNSIEGRECCGRNAISEGSETPAPWHPFNGGITKKISMTTNVINNDP